MRKLKFLLMMAFVASSLLFVGCDPEDNTTTTNDADTPASLVGTKWKGEVTTADSTGVETKIVSILDFKTDSAGMVFFSYQQNGQTVLELNFGYTYTYIKPNGTMTLDETMDPTGTVSFVVNGNTLTYTASDGQGHSQTIVYTRYEGDDPGTDPTNPMIGTEWVKVESHRYQSAEGPYVFGMEVVTLSFYTPTSGIGRSEVIVPEAPEHCDQEVVELFYTYENNGGTLSIVEDGDTFAASYTLQGNTLVVFDGDSETRFSRKGAIDESLLGTAWMVFQEDEREFDGVTYPDFSKQYLYFNSSDTCVYSNDYQVPDYPSANYSYEEEVSYTYANGRGTLIINENETKAALPFVVNGNTLVITTFDGDNVALTRYGSR